MARPGSSVGGGVRGVPGTASRLLETAARWEESLTFSRWIKWDTRQTCQGSFHDHHVTIRQRPASRGGIGLQTAVSSIDLIQYVFNGPLFGLFDDHWFYEMSLMVGLIDGHLLSGECGREADHPAGSTRAQDWRCSYLVEVLTCPQDGHPEE